MRRHWFSATVSKNGFDSSDEPSSVCVDWREAGGKPTSRDYPYDDGKIRSSASGVKQNLVLMWVALQRLL